MKTRRELLDLADSLSFGVQADIFYDAGAYGDESGAQAIEDFQNDVYQAIQMLKDIAEELA